MEWRRVDLHVHTPGSRDYQDSGASYIDILRKARAEGMDVIAITDHNSVAGYAAMMREIEDLERWEETGRLLPAERDRLAEYRELRQEVLVLPGFEFTAMFGFHILSIFDERTPIRAIEHVLLRLGVPLESLELGETEIGSTVDVLTAYETMAKAGALVIAAHANSTHGVAMVGLGLGGQTRIAYTQNPNLHALEVTDLEVKRRRTTASFFNGSKPEYPRRMHCIQGSDAHRIQGEPGSRQNLGVGERATELLLPEVSFGAIKSLFLSNEFHRVRPCSRAAEPFDFVEEARKEGPSIVLSFHEQMTRQGGRLHRVLQDVVAFANANGGTIYIGVGANPKAPPLGVENPEQAMALLRAEIERQISPPLEVSMMALKSQGRDIIRVEVPKGIDPPYALEGSKIYVRKEAETSLAMRDELVDLVKRTVLSSVLVPASPEPSLTRKEMTQVVPASHGAQEAVGEEKEHPEATESPVPSPRTGVEIVDTIERNGVFYHTLRDLRDGAQVRDVTRQSARRLWRYAIALKEKQAFEEKKVSWVDNLGLWHKYLRAGKPHYDLVQRDKDGNVHIYYGVSEEGISGPWRQVVGSDE